MKVFKTILLLLILLSCKNEQKNKSISTDDKNSKTKESKEQEVSNTAIKKLNHPEWIEEFHTEESSEYVTTEIVKFDQLNDSLSSCVISYNDGVCATFILFTHISKKIVDKMEIAKSCDHEQSNPEYRWSEFNFENERTVWRQYYIETIPDSLLNQNNDLEKRVDLDDFKQTKRGLTLRHRIFDSGKITAAIID